MNELTGASQRILEHCHQFTLEPAHGSYLSYVFVCVVLLVTLAVSSDAAMSMQELLHAFATGDIYLKLLVPDWNVSGTPQQAYSVS